MAREAERWISRLSGAWGREWVVRQGGGLALEVGGGWFVAGQGIHLLLPNQLHSPAI